MLGTAIECQGGCTHFLTSATLARAVIGRRGGHDNLKIEVRHEGNGAYQGFLTDFDLITNFTIITVKTSLHVYVGDGVGILPRGRVLALGRGISGKLMARSVILAGNLSASEDDEDITCKIPEAWEGGPLFTFDGNFIGMSLFLVMERACFVSRVTILGLLEHMKGLKGFRSGETPIGEKSNSPEAVFTYVHDKEYFGDLDSMGYPRPPITTDDGMILVNTFEETFGHTYPEGVWSEFSEKASSNIEQYVVALASFNGEKRCFACTGFFIEWKGSTTILTSASLVRSSSDENKIDENLRIEVLLYNKQCIKGTLHHYSLHYNVALVSVKDCCGICPAIVRPQRFFCSKVAAVGRCFKSGALMAASGNVVSWSGTLDCTYIERSSFKITKAGIGGPFVNLDGEVIGMNFYDRRTGTPFLPWTIIDIILAHFGKKSKAAEFGSESDSNPSGVAFWKMKGDDSDCLSRWPVPAPCWRHPDNVDEDDELDSEPVYLPCWPHPDVCKDKFEDDVIIDSLPRCVYRKRRYGYEGGMKVALF